MAMELSTLNTYVDLDDHGRPTSTPCTSSPTSTPSTPSCNTGFDPDAHRRQQALAKLGEVTRRRSAVREGEFFDSDLCGRGDPRVFDEISRRLTAVRPRLDDRDLRELADLQDDDDDDDDQTRMRGFDPHDNPAAKHPVRRTLSIPFRRSRSLYAGVCRLLRRSRRTTAHVET